jgi:hypothetical protein
MLGKSGFKLVDKILNHFRAPVLKRVNNHGFSKVCLVEVKLQAVNYNSRNMVV